jgi:hypothetical protein
VLVVELVPGQDLDELRASLDKTANLVRVTDAGACEAGS